MSHKIGNTWPIDAKNALLNAESTVYTCANYQSHIFYQYKSVGLETRRVFFFWGGGHPVFPLKVAKWLIC